MRLIIHFHLALRYRRQKLPLADDIHFIRVGRFVLTARSSTAHLHMHISEGKNKPLLSVFQWHRAAIRMDSGRHYAIAYYD